MNRPIVTINFDNDEELFDYVNGKGSGNRAEFIRYCIRKEMSEERKSVGDEKDLEARIEKIVRKCLKEYQPTFKGDDVEPVSKDSEADEIMAAIDFFEED